MAVLRLVRLHSRQDQGDAKVTNSARQMSERIQARLSGQCGGIAGANLSCACSFSQGGTKRKERSRKLLDKRRRCRNVIANDINCAIHLHATGVQLHVAAARRRAARRARPYLFAPQVQERNNGGGVLRQHFQARRASTRCARAHLCSQARRLNSVTAQRDRTRFPVLPSHRSIAGHVQFQHRARSAARSSREFSTMTGSRRTLERSKWLFFVSEIRNR